MKTKFKGFKKAIAAISAMAMMATAVASSSATMNASAATTTRTASYSCTKTGDTIAVTINLNASTNIASLGIKVNLGDGFEFASTDGYFAQSKEVDTEVISNKSYFYYRAATSNTSTTKLLTFYIEPTTSYTTSNNTFTFDVDVLADVSGNKVTVSGAGTAVHNKLTTSYKLGDVNNDGSIDATDATAIKSALSSHYVSKASVAVLDAGLLDKWFPKISSAKAADANIDNYITDADATVILNCYAEIMAGSYTGKVGKTYSVTF